MWTRTPFAVREPLVLLLFVLVAAHSSTVEAGLADTAEKRVSSSVYAVRAQLESKDKNGEESGKNGILSPVRLPFRHTGGCVWATIYDGGMA